MNIFYKKFFLLLVSVTLSQFGVAQEKLTKTIEKTIPMNANSAFHIENKYGNIELTGWDKNSVEIIMNVKVYDKNNKEDQAMNLLERIQSEIKIVGDIVTVTSQIVEKNPNAFTSFFSKANPIDLNKSNFQIDYAIHLPKNIATTATNKFGDLIVDDCYGSLTADIQHGNIWINNNLKEATISIKFGTLKTKALTTATLDLKNAELDLKSSENLTINSNGSTLKLAQVSAVNFTSNKDKISINSIENLSGDYKYSTVTINNLIKQVNATMKVTDFSIAKITNLNPLITIEQESSEITVAIDSLNFNFHAYLQEGVLRIPKTFQNIKNTVIDKNQKIREINATYGKKSTGNFSIKGYKGTIILKDTTVNK